MTSFDIQQYLLELHRFLMRNELQSMDFNILEQRSRCLEDYITMIMAFLIALHHMVPVNANYIDLMFILGNICGILKDMLNDVTNQLEGFERNEQPLHSNLTAEVRSSGYPGRPG